MALAKAESEKYQQWSTETRQRKTTVQKKNERQAALPKWMTEQKESSKVDQKEIERKKKELEEMLKN